MLRNKKLRTVFCGILIFLLVFALFCLGDYGIRYYHTPIKKDYDYTGTGMLVSLTEPDTFEQVSVEIHGKALHYLWGNQEDAIAGNVWMNGERLFVEGADDMGFYAPFIDEEPSVRGCGHAVGKTDCTGHDRCRHYRSLPHRLYPDLLRGCEPCLG